MQFLSPPVIVGLVNLALLLLQFILNHWNIGGTNTEYGSWLMRLLSTALAVSSAYFYSMVSTALRGSSLLAVIPFGYYLYYSAIQQWFHASGDATMEDNERNAVLGNLMGHVYFIAALGIGNAVPASGLTVDGKAF